MKNLFCHPPTAHRRAPLSRQITKEITPFCQQKREKLLIGSEKGVIVYGNNKSERISGAWESIFLA
jgi:hypothetical protein